MAPKKHTVKFTLQRAVEKLTKVQFRTKDGPVKFTAEKPAIGNEIGG